MDNENPYISQIRILIFWFFITSGIAGLPCNIYSFFFYIKRRKELGNSFLSYLNIADSIECLSAIAGNLIIFINASENFNFVSEMKLVAFICAIHVSRCSVTVTGILAIYLNILRTSAIIWPMAKFNRRNLHVSLIFLVVFFIGVETAFGVFFSYPHMGFYLKSFDETTNITRPFNADHPLRAVFNHSIVCLGAPIVILVVVCCIISTCKLIRSDNDLSRNGAKNRKRKAAITVLILSIQYGVLNSCALLLFSLEYYYDGLREEDRSKVKIPQNLLLSFGTVAIHLNSILNPVVYIWRVRKLREPLKKMVMKIISCSGANNLEVQPSTSSSCVHD